ncbi:MAG: bifunctional heptose 7-phosphate kinase/heptose 1-phosphate adenyltransferase [Kiritimatiellia bacterium]|jgi:rfaE bifunctional protein kinase chain/domain
MMKIDLEKLGRGRIGVIGDFCLDVYWHADMTKSELSRETPHFPLPIVQERFSPGGAGNVTANLLALRPAEVHALGVFGDDWRGTALRDLLEKEGARLDGIVADATRMTNAYVKPLRKGFADHVVHEDPRLDFINSDSLSPATEAKLLAALDALAPRIDVLCVCDQLPFGCVTANVRARLATLGRQGLPIIVDSRDRIGLYEGVIAKVNNIEAAKVFQGQIPETAFDRLAMALEERTGHAAVVTVGERGCHVSEQGQVQHVDACRVEGEIDFCGAGDTFLSGFAASLAAGFPLHTAAVVACCCSAVTIRKLRTTGTATREELASVLEAYEQQHERIQS